MLNCVVLGRLGWLHYIELFCVTLCYFAALCCDCGCGCGCGTLRCVTMCCVIVSCTMLCYIVVCVLRCIVLDWLHRALHLKICVN